MTNLEKYKSIFAKVLKVREEELNSDFTFANVDKWDSMAHVTLISELEDAFDIMFEPEDILNYGSFENGIKILEKYNITM